MISTRHTADERRASVISAAITEFARAGYAGTSTEVIATRAGISQPYLFRLFGTKKDLFIATYRLVAGSIEDAFTAAAEGLDGDEALTAMGLAYVELMQDAELLQTQLHAFAAAAADPDIAAVCRQCFDTLWHLARERTGLDHEALRQFFAQGMLLTVISAIDLLSIPEPWALSFCPNLEKPRQPASPPSAS
jgi:AcrR family transcriptional regulator